nr:helix-turn-helix transcriptional regulator [Burkholderia sp. Ac-20349]
MGEILSSARQAKGLTQAEAAVRIGVGQPRISSLESTRTESLSLSQLLELTALYGLELCIRTKDEREAAEVEW